jgi:hypothetical protein
MGKEPAHCLRRRTMTVPHDKTYPTNATNKTWQAKKTVGDKMLTKTGLGDKLTAAEKAWKEIPWDELDLSKATITSVNGANKALSTAKEADKKVEAAKVALKHAYDEARVTAATKGLSSGTKTAATNAENALDEAHKRLGMISITEFEDKVKELDQPVTIMKVYVNTKGAQGATVADGGTGKWNRKDGELKTTGLNWKVGKAGDYHNQELKVSGTMVGSDPHAEGISKLFANDMKLKSGSSDTFVSAH